MTQHKAKHKAKHKVVNTKFTVQQPTRALHVFTSGYLCMSADITLHAIICIYSTGLPIMWSNSTQANDNIF